MKILEKPPRLVEMVNDTYGYDVLFDVINDYLFDKFTNNTNYPLLENIFDANNAGYLAEDYMSRSLTKRPNKMRYNMYKDWSQNPDIPLAIFQEMIDGIRDSIYNRYAVKWKKIYDALNLAYNPLENYSMSESTTTNTSDSQNVSENGTTSNSGDSSHTGDNSRSTSETIAHDESNSGTNSETTAHDEDNSTTKSGNITSAASGGFYGFNSKDTATKSTTNSGNQSNSDSIQDVKDIDETKSGNTTEVKDIDESRSGSVSDSIDESDEFSSSGSHSKTTAATGTKATTETKSRSGNIGVTTSQQMLQSELEVRRYDFYKMIFNDMDSLIFMKIY